MTSGQNKRQIFADNLQYYLSKCGKSRKDLCDTLGLRPSTVGDWCRAEKFPRIDKIELLANYFRIKITDLIEPRNQHPTHNFPIAEPSTSNYINDAIREIVAESSIDIDIESLLADRISEDALSLARAYDKIKDHNAKKLLWDITQKILDKQDAC